MPPSIDLLAAQVQSNEKAGCSGNVRMMSQTACKFPIRQKISTPSPPDTSGSTRSRLTFAETAATRLYMADAANPIIVGWARLKAISEGIPVSLIRNATRYSP